MLCAYVVIGLPSIAWAAQSVLGRKSNPWLLMTDQIWTPPDSALFHKEHSTHGRTDFDFGEVHNADGSPCIEISDLHLNTGLYLSCDNATGVLPSRTINEDVFIFPAFANSVDANLWGFLHQFLKPGIERVNTALPDCREHDYFCPQRAKVLILLLPGQFPDQPADPKSLAIKWMPMLREMFSQVIIAGSPAYAALVAPDRWWAGRVRTAVHIVRNDTQNPGRSLADDAPLRAAFAAAGVTRWETCCDWASSGAAREGIEKIARADVVIGMHGAGLSHCLWMREGAVVVEIAAGGLWNKHFFRMLCSDFGSYVQLHPDPGGTSDQNEYIQQFRASRQPTTVGPAHAAEIAACTRRLALASYAVRAGLGEAAGPWLRDARDACDAVAGLTRMAVYDTEEPSTPADKEGLLLTGTIVRKGLVLIEPKSNRPASFGTNSTKRTPIPGRYGGG